MIEKIIDKYFAKKALVLLRQTIAVIHHDTKVVKTNDRYEIYIKRHELNDSYYKHFYDINFRDSIEDYLIIYNQGEELLKVAEKILLGE